MAITTGGAAATASEWPTSVQAIYRISLSGLDLGNFEFSSSLRQRNYALTGDARVSAMFGAYEWRGQTRSSGSLASAGPIPASYTFAFKNQSKHGNINMSFAGDSVTKVDVLPYRPQHPSVVPVTREHLKGVLDPLSAIMALSRSRTGRLAGVNPCSRRLPIFDGKQRFDLVLSFKRTANVSEVGGKGGGQAFVCRVKYVPIAGIKLNEETQELSRASGIEIWMMPLHEAGVFVPYHVAIPLAAGTASMTMARLNVETTKGKVALSK